MYKVFKSLGTINLIKSLSNCILEISSGVFLFKYDVAQYEYFLNKMSKYNCKQLIFTSEIFFKILKKIDKNEIRIREIKITEDLAEEFDDEIKSLILELYSDDNISITKLLNRLKLFEESDGIEIDHIHLSLKEDRRTKKIKIYNNGIISTTLSEKYLCEFLIKYLGEIKL
ncbi:hypothetical protein HS141_11330 [Cetobacterium somerae]|uniref:hypothetical protein n=1 Tax=Cetobacterium somerae TaxID=188913 RepID=UPI00211E57D6|nr:hypothetical protein [Cetobacterium somerae]MCQ9627523.1 hypothetical protein [Cetobacterium somerae]